MKSIETLYEYINTNNMSNKIELKRLIMNALEENSYESYENGFKDGFNHAKEMKSLLNVYI